MATKGIEPFKMLKNDVSAFIKEHRIVLYVIVFIGLIGYGFEVSNFSLTIDEEMELARAFQEPFKNVYMWHIGYLRFFLGWLRSVFSLNGAFVPYVTTFMAVVWLGASAGLWCVLIKKYFKKASSLALSGFVAMYMTVPFVIPELLIFATTCDITFFANFLITFALYLIDQNKDKKRASYYVWAGLAAFVAVNIYQAYAGVFVTGFAAMLLLWALTRASKREITFKNIFYFSKWYVILGGAAVGGYVAFTKLFTWAYQLKSTAYVDNMFGWSSQGFSRGLYNIASSIYRTISPKGTYGSRIVLATLVVLIIFVLAYFVFNRNRQGLAVVFIGAFFTLSVYALPILLGSSAQFRMLQTLLPFMGICWFLFLHYTREIKWLKGLTVAVAIYFVSQQVLLLNTFFYSSHVMSQTDQWNTKMIGHDIQKATDAKTPEVPVVFVGKHEENIPQAVKVYSVGGSMINWQGTKLRIYDVMYLQGFDFGLDYFSYYNNRAINEKGKKLAENMPLWPAEGSILVTDDMIVVKLGEEKDDSQP